MSDNCIVTSIFFPVTVRRTKIADKARHILPHYSATYLLHCLLAEGERPRTAAEQQQANKSTIVRVRCSGGGNGIVFVIEQVDRAIRSWREDAHYFCRLSRHYFWRGLLSLWFALFYTLHAFARTNTHIHTRAPVEWRATNAW